jgi:hypothetical protein
VVVVAANTQTYTLLMDGALAFFAKNNTNINQKSRRPPRQQPENDDKKNQRNDNSSHSSNAYTFVASLLERMLVERNNSLSERMLLVERNNSNSVNNNNNNNENNVVTMVQQHVVAPNVTHFHKVMTAAVKYGVKQDNQNIAAAEEWLVRLLSMYRDKLQEPQQQQQQQQLQQLQNDDDELSLLAPTGDTFAIVIAAWSKIGFPLRAEFVLQQLVACHVKLPADAAKGGGGGGGGALLDLRPRREHYESCINAWIQASYFARRKQQRVARQWGGGNHHPMDNNNNNRAGAAAGMSKMAGYRAEALVLQMMEMHHQQPNLDIKPTVQSLVKVLTCWVQSQTPPPPPPTSSLQNDDHTTYFSAYINSRDYNIKAAERSSTILKLLLETQQEEEEEEQDGKQKGSKGDCTSNSSSSIEEKRQHHKQEQDRSIAKAYVHVIQAWSCCCCYSTSGSSSNENDPSFSLPNGLIIAATPRTAPIEMVEMLLRQLQDRKHTTTTTGHAGAVPTKAWQKACTHAIAAWGRVIATAGGGGAHVNDDAHFKNAAVERAQAIFDGAFSMQRESQQKQNRPCDDDDEGIDDDDNNGDDNDGLVVNAYHELLHVYRLVGDGVRVAALRRRMEQLQLRDSHQRSGNSK